MVHSRHVILGVLLLTLSTAAEIRFANYFGDGMVLQKEPDQANVWGYGDAAIDAVTVLLDGVEVAQTTVDSDLHWNASLPATQSGGPHTIEVTSGNSSANISDVMFGEVWVCSGQSNMEFEFNKVQDYEMDMNRVVNMSNIRLLKISRKTSTVAMEEPVIGTTWQKPGRDPGTQYFSGLCLLFAMELSPHINDQPIGMIASSWGGTPVEAWSDSAALNSCGTNFNYGDEPEHQNSQLWNGMIAPLTGMTIKGAIWYQGESNSGHAAEYKCSFKAMIDDWRVQFNADSGTNAEFPFGFVQLASWREENYPTGFIDIRWTQTYEFGYVPNPGMKNVFMAVAHDLPDFDSPYGGIHPRDKEDIAIRLALAARGVAYNQPVDYQGPFPTSFSLSGDSMIIEYDDGNGNIEVKNSDGFEVCCKSSASEPCSATEFSAAPVTVNSTSSVTIDTSACQGKEVAAVRYAWEETPCQFKECPVYEKENDLPAPCFKKEGPF